MKVLENSQFKLEIERDFKNQSRATIFFKVKLLNGTWPSNDSLISYCDNLEINESVSHFGGRVNNLTPTLKYVAVYID